MIGTIIGDIIGSPYEFSSSIEQKPISLDINLIDSMCNFTDDTILTIATMDAILNNDHYYYKYSKFGLKYPSNYGGRFRSWLLDSIDGYPEPYNSYGNGSAMRVSPVAFTDTKLENVLKEAKKTALCTHNHPEGIKGAEVVAGVIFLAINNTPKEEIKNFIESYGYDINLNFEDLRKNYRHVECCMKTLPPVFYIFLNSNSFEDGLRKMLYIGGDTDTTCAILGGMLEAYYKKIPDYLIQFALSKLNDEFKLILNKFYNDKVKPIININYI